MKPSALVDELLVELCNSLDDRKGTCGFDTKILRIVRELEEALEQIVALPKYEYIKGRLTFLVMREIAQRALKGVSE